MVERWLPIGVFAVGLLLAIFTAILPQAPTFYQPDTAVQGRLSADAAKLPAAFAWADLPHPTPSAHAVTVTEMLPDDRVPGAVLASPPQPLRLTAAWFGGSREGAGDVALYQSVWSQGQAWSPAKVIMTRARAEADLGRNIRKLGNPLLMSQAGRLHLFFVSVSYGGWAGSAINRTYSDNDGLSWSSPQRLILSPFFNLSTLVRNPGTWMSDGSLGLPVYHEFITKHGEWLRLDPEGRVLGKSRMPMSRPALQPAVVPLSATHGVAALRDAGPGQNQVQWSETHDGGETWTAGSARSIPNPNAAVAMIALQDGSLLMACNPIGANRNQLSLLRSNDQGSTWILVRLIEASPDDRDEFSYPALLQDTAGHIHLLYTWKRQHIRHATFTQAWLNQPGNPNIAAVPQ